jgi:CheY-like chemotaxis protein
LDKTVLVVDDNDRNRELFHDVLEAHGHNVPQKSV